MIHQRILFYIVMKTDRNARMSFTCAVYLDNLTAWLQQQGLRFSLQCISAQGLCRLMKVMAMYDRSGNGHGNTLENHQSRDDIMHKDDDRKDYIGKNKSSILYFG